MSQKISDKVEVSPTDNATPTITLDAKNADVSIGGKFTTKLPDGKIAPGMVDGDLHIKNKNDKFVIQLRGTMNSVLVRNNNESITIQLDGLSGKIGLLNGSGGETISLIGQSADIKVGGSGQAGDIYVKNATGKDTIHFDGNSGDIVLENADCAEDFEIANTGNIDPGTVVVFDEQGKLHESTIAYDKRVAGVISGSGSTKPGIILGRQNGQRYRIPLALIGKVFCKVDAQFAPIRPGDMLTTSPTPGFAMKADDPIQAFGSVIGKALGSLDSGKGLLPIIVALQ